MSSERKHAVLLATLCALAALAPGAAAAQTAGGDGIVSIPDDGPSGPIDGLQAVADGVVGLVAGFSPADFVADLRGNEPDAATEASDLRTFLNENNQSFIDHTNTVIDAYNASVDDTTYVLETNIQAADSDSVETIYVVATANGSAVTSYEAVNSTDKTVDASRTLSAFEAEDLNEDVREYHDEYVTTGTVPEKGYYIQMAGKYGLSG